MTHYALPRGSGHARSSSTSAKWSRKARSQESSGGIDDSASSARSRPGWRNE